MLFGEIARLGYVNALVVLYPKTDGTLVAAVGPVFSYYEFRLLGTTRLNDDEWKTMLTWNNKTEYLPMWLKDVYGLSEPWPMPEYASIALLVTMTTLTATIAAVLKTTKTRNKTRNKLTRT
jgi:hypothetical protein